MAETTDVTAMADRFARTVTTYDAGRRTLIPRFDDFYTTVLDLVDAVPGEIERILDLGAGTGLATALLVDAHPDAEVVALDATAEMLAEARRRPGLGDVTFVEGSFTDTLPPGPFDAVVSVLAIHHIDDAAKADLYRRAAALLRPGGVFVNAEQVTGATDATTALAHQRWIAAARAAGATDDDLAASAQRMESDQCSPVEEQLAMLRAAGLVDVDCTFRHTIFAVLSGFRPAP